MKKFLSELVDFKEIIRKRNFRRIIRKKRKHNAQKLFNTNYGSHFLNVVLPDADEYRGTQPAEIGGVIEELAEFRKKFAKKRGLSLL